MGFPRCSPDITKLILPGLLGVLSRIKFYSNDNSIRSFVFGLPFRTERELSALDTLFFVEFELDKSASISIMSKYGFIYCLVCVTVTVIVFCISFMCDQVV